MKHTLKRTSPTQVEFNVTLDAADLSAVRPLTVAKLAQDLKVAGFRKGKAPAHVAEKNLDQNLLESQVVEDAINKHMVDILETEDLRPLDRPHVDVKEFVPKSSLNFEARVEVLPEVKLGDYKKLKAEKEKVTVSAAEVNEVLERMQVSMATKVEVERAAKDGDEAWIDFDGVDEKGEPVAGASGKDYPLQLGSGTFIPGFDEGIIGKKPGETFELPLTFPSDYHAKALAGAKVTFKTTLKGVKEVAKPALDDELAKKAGPFETLNELKADVKKELLAQKQESADNKLKDSLVEQLVKVSDVPVPESLIEDQMQQLERDMTQNLMYRGLTLDQYLEGEKLTHDEWHEKELKPAAERRIQVGLVLSELSKVEKIEVSQDELEARLQAQLQQYTDPELLARFDSPDGRRDLANRVMTEKTVDRLVELNTK